MIETNYETLIRLDTLTDIQNFVDMVKKLPGRAVIKDGKGFCVNAKSVLGVMASLEFDTLYLCTDDILPSTFDKFLII